MAVDQFDPFHGADQDAGHADGRFLIEAGNGLEDRGQKVAFLGAEIVFAHHQRHDQEDDGPDQHQQPDLRL